MLIKTYDTECATVEIHDDYIVETQEEKDEVLKRASQIIHDSLLGKRETA